MVKKENIQNLSNSLLQTATNKRLGASKLALTAFRSGARPPVKRVRVKSGDSRVSDLTVSVAENALPAVVHEINVGDIDIDSSVLGMSLASSASGNGRYRTTQSIGKAVKTNPQPKAYAKSHHQKSSNRPVVKKSMDLQDGIKFTAPSPMTLDRVQVQMGQERNAPESKEYKIQQEEEREKKENELYKQRMKEKKLLLRKAVEETFGEGFEAQLEDFSHAANPVAAAAVKKKSLVKKIFSKIRHKSPEKNPDGKPRPITATEARLMARRALLDASKQRKLQNGNGQTTINNDYLPPRFPISEIVTQAKDDSISDLGASARRFPVNEIVTNGVEQARDDETISTLGTPQIFDKVDRFLDQRDRAPMENQFHQVMGQSDPLVNGQLLIHRGSSPFESQEDGQQFQESRFRHRLGSALVDQMDSVSALSNHADGTAATDDTGAIEVVMGRCNPTGVVARKDPNTGQLVAKSCNPVDIALAAICGPPMLMANAASNSAGNVDNQEEGMPTVLKSSGQLSPVKEENRLTPLGLSPSSGNGTSPQRATLSPTSKFNFAIDEAIRKVQTQMKKVDVQGAQEAESINAVADNSANLVASPGTGDVHGQKTAAMPPKSPSNVLSEDSDRYSIPDLEGDKTETKNRTLAQNVKADFMASFAQIGSDQRKLSQKIPPVSSTGVIDLTAIESATFGDENDAEHVRWKDQQTRDMTGLMAMAEARLSKKEGKMPSASPRRDAAFRFDDLMDIAESKLASSNEGIGSDDRYSVENDTSPRKVVLGQRVVGNAPDRSVPIVRGVDVRASTPRASGAQAARETVMEGGNQDVEIYYNPTCESLQEDGVLKTLMNSFSFRSRSMEQKSPMSNQGDEGNLDEERKEDMDTVKRSSRRKGSPQRRSRKPTPGDLRSPTEQQNGEEPSFLPSSPNGRSTTTSNAFAGFFSDGLFDLLSGEESTMTKEAMMPSRGESFVSGEPILSQATTESARLEFDKTLSSEFDVPVSPGIERRKGNTKRRKSGRYEDELSEASTTASSTAIIKEGSGPKLGMMCGAVPLYLLYSMKNVNDGSKDKAEQVKKAPESPHQDLSPKNQAQASPKKSPRQQSSPRRIKKVESQSPCPESKSDSSCDVSVPHKEITGTYDNPYMVPSDDDAECKENNASQRDKAVISPRTEKVRNSSGRMSQPSQNPKPESVVRTSKSKKGAAPVPDKALGRDANGAVLTSNAQVLNLVHAPRPSDVGFGKNARDGVLLDHDDAYWDTLSTIASTRDRSTEHEKPQKKVNQKPGPIPIEITMKKKSEGDVPDLKKVGQGPNAKVDVKLGRTDIKSRKDHFAATTKIETADEPQRDHLLAENQKPNEVARVSRFGSETVDDVIDAPPSHSTSGLRENEKTQTSNDTTNSKSSRVASLIAKFETARTEMEGTTDAFGRQMNKTSTKSPQNYSKSSSEEYAQSHMNGGAHRSVSWGYEEVFEPLEPRQKVSPPKEIQARVAGRAKDVSILTVDEGVRADWNAEKKLSGNGIYADPHSSSGSSGYMPVQRSYSVQDNEMVLRSQSSAGFGVKNHSTETSGDERYGTGYGADKNPTTHSGGSGGYEPAARSYSMQNDRTPLSPGDDGFPYPITGVIPTMHSNGSEGYHQVSRTYTEERRELQEGPQTATIHSGGSAGYNPDRRSYSAHENDGRELGRHQSTEIYYPPAANVGRDPLNTTTRSSGSEGLDQLPRPYSPIPGGETLLERNEANAGFKQNYDESSSRSDDSPYSLYEKLPDAISPRSEHVHGIGLSFGENNNNPGKPNPLSSLSQDWALPQSSDGIVDQAHGESARASPRQTKQLFVEHSKESLRRNGSPLGNMSSSSQSDTSSESDELHGSALQPQGAHSKQVFGNSPSRGKSEHNDSVPPEIIQKPLLLAASAGKGLVAAASAALFSSRQTSGQNQRIITSQHSTNDSAKARSGSGRKGDENQKEHKTHEGNANRGEHTVANSTAVIDLTEREGSSVESLTVEEEQNLITRTLELSKAILSSVNAQNANMSDQDIARSLLSLESEDIAKSLLSLEANEGPSPTNLTVPVSVTVQSPKEGSALLNHSIQSLLKSDRVVQNLEQESAGGTIPSISLSTASQDSPVDINALFSKYDDLAHHLLTQNDQLKSIANDGLEKKDFSDSEHTPEILNKLQELRRQRSRAISRFNGVDERPSKDSSAVTEDRDPPATTNPVTIGLRERNRLSRYTADHPRSTSTGRGYMFERPLNLGSRHRSRSAEPSRNSDPGDTRDTDSVSTHSGSTRTTASKKARRLRKQLDEALLASKAIRQSQEKLGSELRSFKQRFYDRNNELEDQAFQAMGGVS